MTAQTNTPGKWVIALSTRHLDDYMRAAGITSYRHLAEVAGISQTAIYTATKTGRIRDTAAGKVATALHVSPHVFSRWEQVRP